MIVLGLTGSMGMGKTTTARLFAEQGAVIYDADAAVRDLYGAGGLAGPSLRQAFPDAVLPDGSVVRSALKAELTTRPGRLAELESLVFPLLADHRAAVLDAARAQGRDLAVLDIPLLYESGGEKDVDAVVVVTAAPDVQIERVLARSMSPEVFAVLNARQISDAEKRRRGDFLIFTDRGLDAAARQVASVVDVVRAPNWLAERRA